MFYKFSVFSVMKIEVDIEGVGFWILSFGLVKEEYHIIGANDKLYTRRGRLAQSGEHSLSNPEIRGRFTVKPNKCEVKNMYCLRRIYSPVAIFSVAPLRNHMQQSFTKTAL